MPEQQAVEFIDCTSLSVSYDVMGIATVNYTIVRDDSDWPTGDIMNSIEAGTRTFDGYVINANLMRIPNTDWYETRVTLISLAV